MTNLNIAAVSSVSSAATFVDRMAVGAVTGNPVAAVLYHIGSIGNHAEAIHAGMVAILDDMVGLDKRSVVKHDGLTQVFGAEFKGADRQRLVTWVETYTPIRVKFKDNGQFEKLGWSASYVKARKEAGEEVWQINEAAASKWYEAEKTRTTRVKGGNLSKAILDLGKQLVRSEFDRTGVDPTLDQIDAALAKFLTTAETMVRAAALEYWGSEGYLGWTELRAAQIQKDKTVGK